MRLGWTRLTWAPPLDLTLLFRIGELDFFWPFPLLENTLWADMAPLGTWVHGTGSHKQWDPGIISTHILEFAPWMDIAAE